MEERLVCKCCGYLTLEDKYDICPVCFWENDVTQNEDEELAGGPNHVSLREARENYKKYGASEERFVEVVREPMEEEFVNEED